MPAEKRICFVGYDYHRGGVRITDRFGVTEANIMNFIKKVAKEADTKDGLPEAVVTILGQEKDAGGVLLALATIQIDQMLRGEG